MELDKFLRGTEVLTYQFYSIYLTSCIIVVLHVIALDNNEIL